MDLLSEPPFSLPKTLRQVDDAIDANAEIAEAILAVGLRSLGMEEGDGSWKGRATPSDVDKAHATVRQLYRDWSEEGRPERHTCFSPILNALNSHLPSNVPAECCRHRVLVPGAGLGRLVFDICAAGYTVEGNEISYHQLLASSYVLNHIEAARQHQLYPWALAFSNHTSRANQLRCVDIPDIHPTTALKTSLAELDPQTLTEERMNMSAGDFCVVYRQADHKEAFDAVTTCFFIDTAPNLIAYIETVAACLRPGGIWVNLGPLLWHFESLPTPSERQRQRKHPPAHDTRSPGDFVDAESQGIGDPGSFELSNDEVIALVSRYGFDFVEQEQASGGATGYIQDPSSMLHNIYRPAFWVARKK